MFSTRGENDIAVFFARNAQRLDATDLPFVDALPIIVGNKNPTSALKVLV
jgi:hypothetical protein